MEKAKYFGRMLILKYASTLVLFISAFFYSYVAANFLGPENYGLISYLVAFMSSIPTIFGFGAVYDTINIYSAKGFSKELAKKIISASALFLVGVMLLVIFLSEWMAIFLGKGTPEIITIASIVIFFIPLTMVFNSLFGGLKLFGKLLKFTIFEKIMNIIFLLFFLFVLNQGMFSLVYAQVSVAILLLILYLILFKKLKPTPVKYKKKEVKKFFKTAVPSNILTGISRQYLVIILLAFLGGPLLGLFYLIQRFESYFFGMPSSSLLEVAQPFLSAESNKKKSLLQYTNIIFKFQLLTNIFLILVFLLVVPAVVNYFFPAYIGMIPYLPIVAFSFLFVFPFGSIIKSINKNSLNSYWSIIFILAVATIGVRLLVDYGLLGAIVLYLILRFGNFLFVYFALWKIGYKISFVPNFSDLKLFFKIVKIILLNLISSIKGKF